MLATADVPMRPNSSEKRMGLPQLSSVSDSSHSVCISSGLYMRLGASSVHEARYSLIIAIESSWSSRYD